MKLVIVESPTKARTIAGLLGKQYRVTSCYGHVRDLPKSNLGIDVENNFEPKYVIPTKSRKTVTALKREAAGNDVILATDEDREGEAIAWHLIQALGLNNQSKQPKPTRIARKKNPERSDTSKPSFHIQRIVFHEITKRAIKDALQQPRKINENLVSAQQARRVLDRLVGYKLSPFLWKKVARGLSAGRVQSVTVRLIVDRENEIRNFTPQEYWSIIAELSKTNKDAKFEAGLAKINDEPLDKFAIPTEKQALKVSNNLEHAKYTIAAVERRDVLKNPPPPFITSTLQQEAAKRLRFSSKKTMFLAQQLYESGLITYMRTDSVNLSAESTKYAKQWLSEHFGKQYSEEAPRRFTVKSKLAQEAHEAIRPTKPDKTPDTVSVENPDGKKLYELIWQRFMASQMPRAKIAATTIVIAASINKNTNYELRTSGQTITFDGYLKVWKQRLEERILPTLEANDSLKLHTVKPEQHFTEPPPRYSEATLIKTLEEYGIGRPSTYAPTISTIQTRGYVTKEKRRFHPTEVGEVVNRVLTEHFPEIVDIGFTARMENKLDSVAAGTVQWQTVIGEFYKPFSNRLAEKYEAVSKADITTEATDEQCEKCGKPMVIRLGRFGRFLACTGFPECKNTKKLGNGAKREPTKSTGIPCPTCSEGEIVERRVSRGRARGKRFWGCSQYPNCDYATWEKPEGVDDEPKTDQVAEADNESN